MHTDASSRDATRRIVGIEQVAEYLGMTVPAVRAKVYRQQIDHIRLSERSVRFDLDVIDQWLASKEVPAGS
jgi:excisionase family DNA binding protein